MVKIRRLLALAALVSLCVPAALYAQAQLQVQNQNQVQAQVQAQPQREAQSMNLATGAPPSTIGFGDVLDVEVFDTPQLSMSGVRVDRNGDINLPVLGMVHVAGLNAVEAAVQIEAALRKQGLMLAPHVTVSVLEYAAQGATILGQVNAPGVYPTRGNHRLMDMIALAGGLKPMAGKVVSIIHRDDPHHPVRIILASNAKALSWQRNPDIEPGDTVVVGRAGVIYILGAVGKPGAFMINNNEPLSLMQVISLAGGWKENASLSGARLIRKVPGGHEELKLDLKHVLRGKQADIRVRDGDILYVPSSLGKTLGYRGMEAAITAAQAMVYVGPEYY